MTFIKRYRKWLEGMTPKPLRPNEPNLTLKERFVALRNLPPFLRMVWKTDPRRAAAGVALRLLRSGIPLAMLYVGKLIIDEVVLLASQGGGSMDNLYVYVGVELALAVVTDILNRVIALNESLLGDLFSNQTSVLIMRHAASLDLAQFEDSEFYDMLERARRQTVSRTALLSLVLTQAQDAITIISLAVGLVSFYPWLIVLLAVAVIPAFLGESYFNEKSYSLAFSWTPERRELDYLRFTGAADTTAKEVKMFGLSGFLSGRFKELSDQFYDANKVLSRKRARWGSVFALIGVVGYYGAYLFIIGEAVAAVITLGTLTFLSGSFQQLRGMLSAILGRFAQMAQTSLYLKDFFDFLALQPDIVAKASPLPFPDQIRQGFVFENVGFMYPKTEKWAVRGLTFTLQPGEKLALVGENGAGKTTLVKLLARLYEPNEGRIMLDGHDLREYDPEELRHNIGVIFQDFVKFQMTAGDNIAVGQIDERTNQPRIVDSAERSLANSVIEGLPQGYGQIIGRRFQKGVDLSGGQWQKVALARAYMRKAQMLILDEPTAALDARAEHEVFVRFNKLTQGKTSVIISHRFSTVRMADRILVLEGGTMKELGSHEELLALDGKYAELFRLQAEGYK